MTEISPHLFRSGDFELPLIPDGDSFRVHAGIVARHLGVRDAANLVRHLDQDEKTREPGYSDLSTPHDQGVWYLTEPGFYRAVGQRNVNVIKDEKVRAAVIAFQRWVFHEVIPAMIRAGHASDMRVAGTTWSWGEVSAEIRQRYGLDYKPTDITNSLRAAGVLREGCTEPKWPHRDKFWHTGTSWNLKPHYLPDIVAAILPVRQKLGDPQAQQYQLDVLPARKAVSA